MPDSDFSATGGTIVSLFPALGETIRCPCCHRSIPALVLTNAYLCPRHGLFEVSAAEDSIIHLDSGRYWRSWQGKWYCQHQQVESLRAEIFAALDHLYHQGFHATGITLAQRYQDLVTPYVESGSDWFRQIYYGKQRLLGLPLTFQPDTQTGSRWQVIAFELAKHLGAPKTYSYFICTRMNEESRK
ncbi:MAG: TIGR02652 family protein [Leptolyngbyaceae cyanobacterium SM2_5_2]|nr:TIGR02652 family protein [Leptolyngbyaceae cyanobacterium SM2_5_2]